MGVGSRVLLIRRRKATRESGGAPNSADTAAYSFLQKKTKAKQNECFKDFSSKVKKSDLFLENYKNSAGRHPCVMELAVSANYTDFYTGSGRLSTVYTILHGYFVFAAGHERVCVILAC